MANGNDLLPEHVRDLPLETQVAVLYERVKNLGEEVKGLKTALYSLAGAILSGSVLFLISIAIGWLGPRQAVGLVLGWLT